MAVPTDRLLQLSVLGPVQVLEEGRPIELGTPRQRSIIAALALSPGRTVSLDALVSRVWGSEAPRTSVTTLQRYVASLRQALEPARLPHEPPTVIVTDGAGYVLRIPPAERDVARLEQAVGDARALLDGVPDMLRPTIAASRAADAARAVDLLQEALRLWRGRPYADLGDDPEAGAERARLEDLRVAAGELRLIALLGLGRHAEVVGELESMTALHPLHERWWALYAVALVRCGRQAEALEALGTLRSLLADELGVDPSAPLRDLHAAILRQDPSLGWSLEGQAPAIPTLGRVPRELTGSEVPHHPRSPLAFRTPLAGRVAEMSALRDLVTEAKQGRGGVAYLTGEAGVGKTRIVQETAELADAAGLTVAVAGCSEQSPPALWPLRTALSALSQQLRFTADLTPLDAHPDEFRTREHVAESLLRAAEAAPVLVVVEDVQWADQATLRVLEDFVARCSSAPLALVLTRRSKAGDEREVRRVAASVARAGGLRLDLEGLSLEEAEALVLSVDGPAQRVPELWERSGGNPFFLAELSLAGGDLSGSLADVVHARIMGLDPATVTMLQAASLLDVAFDVRMLSLMVGSDEAETIEVLGAAVAEGLVVESVTDTSTHAFSHAVIREVVSAAQSPIAVTIWHTAAVRALADHGDLRRVEQRAVLAHHGERAGRAGAATAWRAMSRAADHARADLAYAEEARLLMLAARLLELDETAGDRERFELLMLVVDACRWSGDWHSVSQAVDEAIVVAERLGDPSLAARAAIATTEGALWQVRPFGTVHAPIVEALERLLIRLGEDQPALRCRAQLALALELYYDASQTARIDSLVADALAHAEQSDDLRLRYAACHGAFVATWRLDTVEHRSALAGRALELARLLDDPRAVVVAETLTLAAASELGRSEVVRADLDRVTEAASRRGLTTAEGVLRILAAGWAALQQDEQGVVAQAAALSKLEREARVPSFRTAVGATMVLAALLSGRPEALRRAARAFAPSDDVPTNLFGASIMLRFGEVDAARAIMESGAIELVTHTFVGPLNAALACDVAATIGPTPLLDDAYDHLLRHAGRMCSGGAAAPIGPVDLYLALGATARGDHAAAARHLEDAVRLVDEWDLPGLQSEVDRVRALVDGCAAVNR